MAAASDDEMSSISPDEILSRQAALDIAAAEFLAAGPTGVFVDELELLSDGSLRPSQAGVTISVPVISANGHTSDDVDVAPSTPRRRRDEPDSPVRAVSPRLAEEGDLAT